MSKELIEAARYFDQGQYMAAADLCRKALRKPKLAIDAKKMLSECFYNQGVVHLFYSGLLDEAEKCFVEAVQYNPKHALALNNLGILKSQQGNNGEAIDFHLRAVQSDPKNISNLRNLAIAYQRYGELEQAASEFKKLAILDPQNAGLYLLRAILLIKAIIPDTEYPEKIRANINTQIDEYLAMDFNPVEPGDFGITYFFLSYHGKSNRDLHKKIARAYLHLCPSLAWVAPEVKQSRLPGRRVKIGIASANLYNHSIGHTTRGIVDKLDRKKFEIVVIHLGKSREDGISKAINSSADVVQEIDLRNLQQAREKIGALMLDVLFYQDIGMEPVSYLLSFARLAPVQLTSFGHPDTTGVPNIDYFISSSFYELEGAQQHYSEKLIQIPNAGTLSYYYAPEIPDRIKRSEFELNDDSHLYFCPQTLFKIHPHMDDVFLNILRKDQKAIIVLIEPKDGQIMRNALHTRLSSMLGELINRVVFVKALEHKKYLQLMHCADVMLDTVHFNGQNTNLEAFAMNIPVVTWPGIMHRERHTFGMYQAMGLAEFSDLIANGAQDYAEKAVKVATIPEHREQLKSAIAKKSSVLYQNSDFVKALEIVLLEITSDK